MKNLSRSFNVIISLIVVFSFFLAGHQHVQAQGSGYVTIDYPKPDGGILSENITVRGLAMPNGVEPPDKIGLCLDSPSSPIDASYYTCTNATAYSCSWDTHSASNGQHHLFVEATFGSTQFWSSSVAVQISNVSILPTFTPTPGGGGSDDKPSTPKTTPTSLIIESPTPTPEETPSPEMTTTLAPVPGRPDLSPIPVAVPAATPSAGFTPTNLLNGSELLIALNYSLDQDKALHLEKIESRISTTQKKFLYFSGKSYPGSLVKLSVNSQPLVMTATADTNGSWTYTLDKPMEPGQHETYVEVNNNGKVEQSGPYPFSIARAQAGVTNPTGASLDLVDPQKEALKVYLFIAGGLVGLAILVLLIFLYMRKIKKMRKANPPIKEPSAI